MTKHRKILLPILLAAAVLLILWITWGNGALILTEITVTSDALPADFAGLRIAHVSDLHNAEMGEKNDRLLAMLREADPDLIAITGDIVDSRRTDLGIAAAFVREAVKIAPCYYVTGNHEARLPATLYAELEASITAAGAILLRNEAIILTRGNASITLAGIDDPSFAGIKADLAALLPEESFSLLLAHRPEHFADYIAAGAELTLSGHAHGGQFRLPLVGGVVAPGQGLFPRYDAGLYTEEGASLIVSRGIGNSIFPFRINNRPEVVLITLETQ